MKICPHCASENIFYSKKRNIYFCEDCDNSFEIPSEERGMRIFISYGHDKNTEIVSKIKTYLSEKGYDVWIDSSEIPKGSDWRERITNGLLGSNGVLSFLSKHSVREPGVCIDELRIAVCLKHAYIKTVLLEHESEVKPPKLVSSMQWIDLSDWDKISSADWDNYFKKKMQGLLEALNSEDAINFNQDMQLLEKRLGVYDNTTKDQQLLKRFFVGRDWLTKKVTQWLDEDTSQTMMIYGVPGAGKSAFSANLAYYNPNVLATIFFEWDNSSLCNTDYVIKFLAYKLAARLPDFRKMLCTMLNDETQSRELINNNHDSGLFDLLILNPIQCCINGDRNTYFIIFDGLDETTEAISNLLLRKASMFPEWLKVLFTSRYEETTTLKNSADETLHLDISSKDNTEDLILFFQKQLNLKDKDKIAIELSKKCEGSFMFATTLCDAIEKNQIGISDSLSLPNGINAFYYEFFNRLFCNYGDYVRVRPFLELLSIEDELPEEIFRKCMLIDKYELWELRSILKSLIVNHTMMLRGREVKSFKFVHKSIKDWLTSPDLASKYFIDYTNAYTNLISLSCDSENMPKLSFDDKLTEYVYNEKYPKWLIMAKQYDKYERLLIQSFNPVEISTNIREYCKNYTHYYGLYSIWRYVDCLPIGYPLDSINALFLEIATFPKQFMVSRFSHRSFQITSFILSECMNTGRFAPIFFEFMSQFQIDSYFRSRASDDGETRDGWDKFYFTRDAIKCLKQCEKLKINIPDTVRRTCERLKLSYNYYLGKNEGMFIDGDSDIWKYGILCDTALFKDICILNDDLESKTFPQVKEEHTRYNTLSLQYYLTHSDEEDMNFIKQCIDNLADLDVASRMAISILDTETEKHYKKSNLKNVNHRVEFIKSLKELC